MLFKIILQTRDLPKNELDYTYFWVLANSDPVKAIEFSKFSFFSIFCIFLGHHHKKNWLNLNHNNHRMIPYNILCVCQLEIQDGHFLWT